MKMLMSWKNRVNWRAWPLETRTYSLYENFTARLTLKSASIPVLWAQLFTPLSTRNTENNESDIELKCPLLVFRDRGTQAVKGTQASESVMADDYLITVAAETNISILSWSFTPTAVKD